LSYVESFGMCHAVTVPTEYWRKTEDFDFVLAT
jgi:hypothetical protein